MEKDTKQPSWITWLVIAAIIAATVWYYSDARKDASELYEEGNVATLAKRAEKGDAEAQYFIGISYLGGRSDLEQNIPLAREWWQKALAQGYRDAGWQLYHTDSPSGYSSDPRYYHYIYQTQGKDAAEALAKAAPHWLEQGVLLGKTRSRLVISDLRFLISAHTLRDYSFQHSAELIAALRAMEKTLTDATEKTYCYELLGILYFNEQDYANAFNYLEKAMEISRPRHITIYRLGRMYEEGLGVARDEHKARDLYASVPLEETDHGLNKNYRLIHWHLAMMQAQGRGGDVDKENAAKRLAELEKILAYDQQHDRPLQNYPSAEQMDALRDAIAAP